MLPNIIHRTYSIIIDGPGTIMSFPSHIDGNKINEYFKNAVPKVTLSANLLQYYVDKN